MGAESSVVLGAEVTNFFFDGWDFQVTQNNGIWNIPLGTSYQTQRSRISILDVEAVGPDGLDGNFIEE
jgi:hypothetical protein